jgi:two-component system sensor kinase FixL
VAAVNPVLAAAVFVADLRYLPGVSISALYFVSVMLTLWQPRRLDPIIAAAGCTLLTALGLAWSAHPADWTVAVANRVLVIIGLWLTALVVVRFKHTERRAACLARAIEREATELRKSEARNRSMLETAVDGIVVIDTRGIIQLVNPAMQRLFGYTVEELRGQNVSVLMPAPIRDEHDAHLARYLESGLRRIIGTGREVEARHKDGRTFPVSISVSELKQDGEHAFVGILRDLTDLKRAQAEAREQAELARLGRMSALIAHEVRNPLAGIRGALDIIGRRLPAGAREQAVLGDIVARLDDLNHFVDDLLIFARPHRPELRRESIAAIFRRLTALMAADPEFAGIVTDVSGDDADVEVDARQIERAFLNLMANAAQALDGEGRIAVTIERRETACRVTVSDSGAGMAPEVLQKVFEPFFTTRHRGTGLGLPVVKRTVEQHGGSIQIESTIGVGTKAIVELPLAPARALTSGAERRDATVAAAPVH